MQHLFADVVQVYRRSMVMVNGVGSTQWVLQPSPLDRLHCRLDLSFLRQGKDVIGPPGVNGKAPDRIGVMFLMPNQGLLAGDHITAVPNDYGVMPNSGTFEIKAVPDVAVGFGAAHHIEVQIFEIAQDLMGVFPGEA